MPKEFLEDGWGGMEEKNVFVGPSTPCLVPTPLQGFDILRFGTEDRIEGPTEGRIPSFFCLTEAPLPSPEVLGSQEEGNYQFQKMFVSSFRSLRLQFEPRYPRQLPFALQLFGFFPPQVEEKEQQFEGPGAGMEERELGLVGTELGLEREQQFQVVAYFPIKF